MTCVDSVSFLSEIIRRLMRDALMAPDTASLSSWRACGRCLRVISRLCGPEQVTRRLVDRRHCPSDQWRHVFDPDAITALGDEFDFYGVSPHFVTDWRWYKDIHGAHKRFNEEAIAAYRAHVANFADYRVVLPAQPPAVSNKLIGLCDEIYLAMQGFEKAAMHLAWPSQLSVLTKWQPFLLRSHQSLANLLPRQDVFYAQGRG